jgi:3-oxoacyl-[acyl-carrier protein] reductase
MSNIIVTGAGRGIGLEIVKQILTLEEEHIVIAVSRNVGALQILKDSHSELSSRLIICQMDLVSKDYSLLKQAIDNLEVVDVLINNAGQLINKSFDQLNDEDWEQMLLVNTISAVRMSRFVLPYLLRSQISHIVHIGSMGGYQGSSKFPGLSAYSVAKGGLAILSECLASEFGSRGLKSNCLCLGAVNTDMLQQAFPGYTAPVESDTMASFIVSFALHQYAVMNGQVIPVTLGNPS